MHILTAAASHQGVLPILQSATAATSRSAPGEAQIRVTRRASMKPVKSQPPLGPYIKPKSPSASIGPSRNTPGAVSGFSLKQLWFYLDTSIFQKTQR